MLNYEYLSNLDQSILTQIKISNIRSNFIKYVIPKMWYFRNIIIYFSILLKAFFFSNFQAKKNARLNFLYEKEKKEITKI